MKAVVLGATFAGVSAACALAEMGYDVSVVTADTYAGGDVVACQHAWRINGRSGEYITMPNGRTKMELHARLKDSGVRILYMAQLCGVFSDGESARGVAIATKYGIFAIHADLIVDASEAGEAAYHVTGRMAAVEAAEYGFDIENCGALMRSVEPVDAELGLCGSAVRIGATLKAGTLNVGFSFPVDGLADSEQRSAAERKARELAVAITAGLHKHDAFRESRVSVLGSHIRPLYTSVPRSEQVSYVEAGLPEVYSSYQQTRLEREAAEKAKRLASACKPGGAALHLMSAGREIKGWSCADSDDPLMKRLRFCATAQGFAEKRTDVLVAGAGAGSAMSAWALEDNGVKYRVIEKLFSAGGTNTVGNVYGAWHGYAKGMYEKRANEVAAMADVDCMSARIGAIMYWQRRFGHACIGGVTVCGAVSENGRIKAALACGPYGFELYEGNFVIDGTADGDICWFAGAEYTVGNDRDGILQTSSMWGYEYQEGKGFGTRRYNSDEDFVSPDSYSDFLRGLDLGYRKNSEYEIVEMLMQRDSRRFACRAYLRMKDICRRACPKDVLSVGLCVPDNHGGAATMLIRLKLYSSRIYENGIRDIRVRMPYRMFLPAAFENVAIVGKSMSGERDAVSLCRMNPDISNAGYAVGTAVAYAVKQHAKALPDVNLEPVQAALRALAVLPEWAFQAGDRLEMEEALAALDDPEDGGFSAMAQDADAVVPALLDALKCEGVHGDNAALALAWFGRKEASERLPRMLEKELEHDPVFEYCGEFDIKAVRKDGYEEIVNHTSPTSYYNEVRIGMTHEQLSYARVNRLIALLGMAGGAGVDEVRRLAEKLRVHAICTGRTAYAHSRIDTYIVPENERIWSLVYAAERMADSSLVPALDTLLDDEFLSRAPYSYAPPIVWLRIALARAAAHCGSARGAAILKEYQHSDRKVVSIAADMSLRELEHSFGKPYAAPNPFMA